MKSKITFKVGNSLKSVSRFIIKNISNLFIDSYLYSPQT